MVSYSYLTLDCLGFDWVSLSSLVKPVMTCFCFTLFVVFVVSVLLLAYFPFKDMVSTAYEGSFETFWQLFANSGKEMLNAFVQDILSFCVIRK